MDISSISTATLRSLLSLTEKREALLAELAEIDVKISSACFVGSTARPAAGKRRGRKPGRKAKMVPAAQAVAENDKVVKPKKKVRKTRKGGVKEVIVAELKEAGAKGISVKDLATKVGSKPQNIHAWFATTGKKAGALKVSPGVYRLKA